MNDVNVQYWAAIVEGAFGWLYDFNFRLSRRDNVSVSYYSAPTTLTVSLEHGCELAMDFRRDGDDRSFSMGELIRLRRGSSRVPYRNQVVANARELEAAVQSLSELLMEVGIEILNREDSVFSDLARARDEFMKEFSIKQDLRLADKKALDAFVVEDYQRVVKELAPLEPYLSEVALKRLQIARTRAGEK